MRARQDEKGSALIIAVVVVIILSAMAVALLTEVVARFQTTTESKDNDEATMICRAGLERARRALYLYRANRTWDPSIPAGAVVGDYLEQWNSILAFNQGGTANPDSLSINPDDKRYFPLPSDSLASVLEGVRQNYAFVRNNTEFNAYGNSQTNWNPNLWTSDDAGLLPEDPDFLQNTVIFGACKPFRSGAYHIYLRDNNDGDSDPLVDADRTIICTVTSILPDGTMRQMEGTLFYSPPTFIPDQALLSGGDMVLSGSAVTVKGSSGNIFANGNLSFSGSPTVTGSSGAAGSVSGSPSGSPPVGGQSPAQMPNIDPTDFATADPGNTFRFDSSGVIHFPNGSTWNTATQGKWYGFDFSSGSWKMSGNSSPPSPPTEPDGTVIPGGTGTVHGGPGYIFHFQTDFTMTGQGNSQPMVATFLVEGNADMGGNRTILPFYGNMAILASRDLIIRGTSGSNKYQALYAAHEQVSIQGTPNIFGAVIAEDAENISTAVNGITGSDLTTGGTPTITYNGGLSTGILLDSNVSIRNLMRTYPK